MKSAWQLTMRILGCTRVTPLLLMTLGITMGSSIALPIQQTESNILEESTLPKKENQKEENEKLHQSLTGKKYYGSSDELKQDIKTLGRDYFKREILSLHTTLGKVNYEETKQLFLHNVLMESLDNGEPAYYNSNILGRYMRKDYGNFERISE